MKEEKITIGASRLPAFFRDVIHATGDVVDVRVTIEDGMATIRKMAETPDLALAFAEFSKANLARCQSPDGFNHKLNSWSLSDWFTATMGELGEAANVAKKLNRVRDGITGNKETEAELRAKLRLEIADAFIYLDLMAQSEGFNLEEAVREVFNAKSEAIGYPVRLGADIHGVKTVEQAARPADARTGPTGRAGAGREAVPADRPRPGRDRR